MELIDKGNDQLRVGKRGGKEEVFQHIPLPRKKE